MNEILKFFIILFIGVLPNILGSFITLRHPDRSKWLTSGENIMSLWVISIGEILVTFFLMSSQPNGLKSIGLSPTQGNTNDIIWGKGLLIFAGIGLISFLAQNILRKHRNDKEFDVTHPNVQEILKYQNNWGKLAYLIILAYMVFAEEIVYRGYLVLYLASITGSFIPWVFISIFLSVLIHLYQGLTAKNIISHLILSSLFIGLTILTHSLQSAITFHLFYNVIWTFNTWVHAKKRNISVQENQMSRGKKLTYIIFIFTNLIILFWLGIFSAISFNGR